MDNGLEGQLKRINNTLFAKLAVRNCQYKIAIEGLRAIEEFGDINVAIKTIEAMLDCVPENSQAWVGDHDDQFCQSLPMLKTNDQLAGSCSFNK